MTHRSADGHWTSASRGDPSLDMTDFTHCLPDRRAANARLLSLMVLPSHIEISVMFRIFRPKIDFDFTQRCYVRMHS